MNHDGTPAPASFAAVATALEAIARAMRTAQTADSPSTDDPEQAIAALLLLREVREQLADWEPGLIETAREAGASWADLAHPLGVSSRQAAERRYLRVRPGEAGTTKEQRVKATRDQRAADRSVASWAHDHAATLRQLAGTITALPDLPAIATDALTALHAALGDSDPAELLGPLTEAGPHLRSAHPDLADRVTDIGRHTHEMRESEHRQRSSRGL
ncbi:type III effector protein [Streptomyces sp. NPDC060027]|uniref:type III effector protein n=1 Tax=Streptomyces sp. NPDC060027 TaxID=3347040 RepID=UPI0036A0B51B